MLWQWEGPNLRSFLCSDQQDLQLATDSLSSARLRQECVMHPRLLAESPIPHFISGIANADQVYIAQVSDHGRFDTL